MRAKHSRNASKSNLEAKARNRAYRNAAESIEQSRLAVEKLIDQFLFPIPGTPADIQKRAENEARLWGGLIRDLKIQID